MILALSWIVAFAGGFMAGLWARDERNRRHDNDWQRFTEAMRRG